MQPALTISYFSDVLCVWAYVTQIKLDELRRQFGDQVCVEYRFLHLFGDVAARMEADWADKGGIAGYSQHLQAMAARFDHIDIHPEIGICRPRSTQRLCVGAQIIRRVAQGLQPGRRGHRPPGRLNFDTRKAV